MVSIVIQADEIHDCSVLSTCVFSIGYLAKAHCSSQPLFDWNDKEVEVSPHTSLNLNTARPFARRTTVSSRSTVPRTHLGEVKHDIAERCLQHRSNPLANPRRGPPPKEVRRNAGFAAAPASASTALPALGGNLNALIRWPRSSMAPRQCAKHFLEQFALVSGTRSSQILKKTRFQRGKNVENTSCC